MTYKCPICESDNTNKEYIDGITIGDRICGNCGFHGSAADFLHTKQNEDQKELIKFIDNTQMDPDVKLALQKVAIWDNIDAKPATLLKRAHECVDLHSNIIDKVPTDKRYNVIRDYIVEYKNSLHDSFGLLLRSIYDWAKLENIFKYSGNFFVGLLARLARRA